MKFRFIVLLLCVITEPIPAHAQEPRTPIKPADPVSVTVRNAPTPATSTGDSMPAPIIYPAALPSIHLADIARTYRFVHLTAPKAVKIANDEKPIIPEEPKQEPK